jgi:hypothetical protein
MLCLFILNLVLNQLLRGLYAWENRKANRALAGLSEEEIEALKSESRVQGFEDVTDGKNVSYPHLQLNIGTYLGLLF